QKLNFTKDSVSATADFDLNYIGNNIDEFTGYAKLYNINLVRENNRFDVDSLYAVSSLEGEQKQLLLESNILSAKISGDYQLSSLHKSVQFYIAGYLPNYIKAPL